MEEVINSAEESAIIVEFFVCNAISMEHFQLDG